MPDIKIDTVPDREGRSRPVFADLDRRLEQIRKEAFELFAGRGYEEGHALEDWLAAERRVFGADTAIVESDGNYEFRVPVEGFKPAEISVTATPRELIVTATAGLGAPDSPAPGLVETAVFRRVVLPGEIAVEEVSASLKQGVLTVVAPKSTESGTNAVAVAA